MKMLKRRLRTISVIACILSCFIFCSCGGSSPGPQEPFLPEIEEQSKFSDRFQLEEEPQFFYDLFGDELLSGNPSSAEIAEKSRKKLLKGNKTRMCSFD